MSKRAEIVHGSRDAEDRWLAARHWRRCTASPCLRKVAGLRCRGGMPRNPDCGGCRYYGTGVGHWWDHVRLYLDADGRYVLLAQPYQLPPADRANLAESCLAFGLRFEISDDSWWAPGHTLAIVVTAGVA